MKWKYGRASAGNRVIEQRIRRSGRERRRRRRRRSRVSLKEAALCRAHVGVLLLAAVDVRRCQQRVASQALRGKQDATWIGCEDPGGPVSCALAWRLLLRPLLQPLMLPASLT